MKKIEDLISHLDKKGEIILFDSLGCREIIDIELHTRRLYYLRWSPRENTGEPREYISFDKAVSLIKKHKPNLFH